MRWFDSPGIYINKNTGKEILIERGYNEIMSTLHELYTKHKRGDWPDKGSTHSYIEVYESILAPYRHTAKNILEIGIFSGRSLLMWEDYFAGTVYGIDCEDQPHGGMADLRPMIASGKHNIAIGDAADADTIKRHYGNIKFDCIIEDASHQLSQQLGIYHNLKHYLAEGGIYVIEDVEDIDFSRTAFEMIDPEKNIEILDRRSVKQRFDDVLVIIK